MKESAWQSERVLQESPGVDMGSYAEGAQIDCSASSPKLKCSKLLNWHSTMATNDSTGSPSVPQKTMGSIDELMWARQMAIVGLHHQIVLCILYWHWPVMQFHDLPRDRTHYSNGECAWENVHSIIYLLTLRAQEISF